MPFLTELHVKLVDDLAHKGQGLWELTRPLTFVTHAGKAYCAPPGFRTDFASVPRLPLAYWLTGNTAHRPAVIHDWLCELGTDRDEASAVFKEAMESIGMPVGRIALMHAGVVAYAKATWRRISRHEAENTKPPQS